MFVILAKLQKAVDAPVSLDSKKKTKSDGKEKDSNNNKSELFDISQHYLFWREEDEVLYHFRDTRVAALLYRCRAQYDGQPESERPLSVLFVISSPTVLRQALEAMKRKSTLKPEITYY
ncbi:hypothetical protein AGDE_12945 [Angomonas deanei]|nr:hypothetical protein AGDE_12945 [Angomonas deanei]|eukprot:EPY23273.1 hypothetical protein AGDE_12945 [Angomonas deanei]